MADNDKTTIYNEQETKPRQSTTPRMKDRMDESRLPTPPPSPWDSQNAQVQAEMSQIRNLEEDEDIIAYLADLGTAFESQTSECPSRNSTTSTIPISGFYSDESFEPLSRLYALTDQILELRDRNSKLFKRVRNLEKLKVLRDADRRLENTFARNKHLDVRDEDTEFAESLLNAMLSNYRDPLSQRRNIRSPSSKQARSKFNFDKQISNSPEEISGRAPKISKWTRVKAAFKWERAFTSDVETMDRAAPLSTSVKNLGIPHNEVENSGTINESCESTKSSNQATTPPTATTSFNEGSLDCPQKNFPNNLECLPSETKEGKKEYCANHHRSESVDSDIIVLHSEQENDVEHVNEVDQGKPMIRITAEKNPPMHTPNNLDKKNAEETAKKPALFLTITIPSNEEEVRCMSSTESNSPLSSSAHTSGGNSPQLRKMHRELSITKDFKRQQSLSEEPPILTSRTHRQDSKWNKVRRAFLTNSTFSVSLSPIRVASRQIFLQDDQEPATAYSCSDSTENLEKMSALNDQTDTQRDYISLREKLGSEFHRKLIEWERLKSLSPRDAVKDTRDIPLSLLNFQETLLPEERLAPEFRKKLQDWKRAKKERRGSAPLEQQRINRRRLTDWQVWRSPFKSEYKNPELMGMRGSYGNGENICSDGRPRLLDDIVRKVETWKKINETPNRDTKHSLQSNSNQFEVVSGLDESEFLTLERVLSLFEKNIDNARTESDACQSDECFDCDARYAQKTYKQATVTTYKSYLDGTQNINNNEVLIQTSVGSYRFEGISQEFTRKLYDWEKYRGISPRSSTFRLLGPAYVPFVEETNVRIPTLNVDEIGSNEHAFKINTLKRSKSVSNLNIEFQATEYFVRRAASLNHLTDRLKNTDFINILPTSIDPQKIDVSKDIAIDDSEREAMIVDIEDVIEETASPLERVQPHQTPVYSVAASETTSIAVPLGTVTSTHKSSPMFLVETEKSLNQKHKKFIRWNGKNDSDEDCLSSEQFVTSNIWNNRKNSFSKDNVDLARLLNKIGNCNNNFNYLDQDYNGKRIKEDNLTYSMESNDKYKIANEFKQTADEKCNSIERQEISTVTYRKENASKTIRKQAFDGTNENETIHRGNLGNRSSSVISIKKSMVDFDLPSNDGQRVSGDGCSDDGMDVTTAEMKFDNEYEEIILDDTINPNRRSLTNFNEYSTNPLTDLSVDCKLGETNHIVLGVNSYLINEANENLKKREENDDAVKIKMDLCHNRNESSRTEETVSAESTQVKEYEQNHEFVNIPISSTVCVQDSCTQGCHHEPTIPTTPLTVSLCREERCLERIIINEETLNKIVVPTASNNCTENLRIVKPSTNGSSAKHFMGDNNRRSSINYETSTDQEMNVKKQCSPTRNVFIKTKRIIFSPFRRVEEHSISKKQNNTSEDDSVSVTKSKNKSRSASPKVNRQDALLRMSFSLPWPLRPTSKDREIKETTDDGNKERQIEIENKRKSFINENKLLQQLQEEPKMQTLKDKQPEENDRVKYFLKQKENLVDVSVQATPNGQQDGAFSTNNSFIVEHGEKKDEVVPPLKLNKCSSDLMHKLQILSSVIAQRDGRTDILSGESCMESHSMRIHRAKQDFLSHRGGPLCHSVMETRSFNDHYEQIVQDRHPKNKKLSLKIEETLDTCKLKKDETKMPVYEDAANGLLENSAVFLPDRVKSASVGMINIDPDTFKRLTESNRGCESLPRTISKQQEPLRPLAKIVNKFKFARLIRGRDTAEGSMSTISRLCKQSLLIDVQNDFEKQWETKDRDK